MSRFTLIRIATIVVVAVVAVAAAVAADEPLSASAILTRAIDAHGGRAAVSTLPDLRMEGAFESGRWGGSKWKLVALERGDGAYRREVTFEYHGRKRTPAELFDGANVHKRRFGSGWDDLPLDEPREEAAHRLPFLVTALERESRLLADADIDGIDAWVIAVQDGRGEARITIGKDTAHVLAIEYPGTSAEGMGTKEEITRQLVWRDLRDIAGRLLPFDVEVRKDGSLEGRTRYEKIEVLDAFDEEWITVADPKMRFVPEEETAN